MTAVFGLTLPRLISCLLLLLRIELCLPQQTDTRIDVLVPELSGRDALLLEAFEVKGVVAERADNDVIIINGIRIRTLTFMIIWPPMICTENF